jgi:hypothetical protein
VGELVFSTHLCQGSLNADSWGEIIKRFHILVEGG